ncbi:hypothetical protein, partial [Myxococcus sp. AM011]|uniref:hypothetical protein n=1 Tax=Myxococcus sp. AM011 TaxID=2745200 RepID=UPI001C3CCB51
GGGTRAGTGTGSSRWVFVKRVERCDLFAMEAVRVLFEVATVSGWDVGSHRWTRFARALARSGWSAGATPYREAEH